MLSKHGYVLAGRERLLLTVAAELGGLESDSLENIINKRVHDAHACVEIN